MAKADRLLHAVQEVLFREWDPIGVNGLREGVDEYKLASHLSQLQSVCMGMSVIDEALHRRVARRLLDLVP